jgi:DNA repair exonuclease SbcCD ATPase subunit
VQGLRKKQSSAKASISSLKADQASSSDALQQQTSRLEQVEQCQRQLQVAVYGTEPPTSSSRSGPSSPLGKQPAASSLPGLATKVAHLASVTQDLSQALASKADAKEFAAAKAQEAHLAEQVQQRSDALDALHKRSDEQAGQLQKLAKVLAAAAQERPTTSTVKGMAQVGDGWQPQPPLHSTTRTDSN